jgi:pimeloyl-ACP methyl ester carboxylesterase
MEYGEAGDGGRAFVLVHGFTGSRDDFADVLPSLAREGRTLAPDSRGHGGTTNPGVPEGYTLEQMSADLAGFLDALDIERCDLLGHSLGGMVTLRFVLAHPERVSSLVLMDTAPGPLTLMPRQILDAGAQVVRAHGMAALAEGMKANPPWERSPAARRTALRMGKKRFWERIEAKLLAMDPEAFANLGAVLADQEGVHHRLGEIGCPTLVIVGEEDQPFLEPSLAMAEAIPDATHVVVPGAAHSPQFENEAVWLEAVTAHLKRAR